MFPEAQDPNFKTKDISSNMSELCEDEHD